MEGAFDSELVGVVGRCENSIESDDEELHAEQEADHFPGLHRIADLQESAGVVDVEAGYDGFLQAENRLLDAFHDFHGVVVGVVVFCH